MVLLGIRQHDGWVECAELRRSCRGGQPRCAVHEANLGKAGGVTGCWEEAWLRSLGAPGGCHKGE